jgi:hypothetical protein
MQVDGRGRGKCALAWLAVGAVLAAGVAGCGGSSSAAAGSPSNAASTSPSATTATTPSNPPRVPLSTPQSAVRSYIEGVDAVNGGTICNTLDANLERTIIKEIVRAKPSEAHSSCAQALTGLVAAITSPSERSGKLPTFHATTTGNAAVVTYVGRRTHHHHTFRLVKQDSGWLIDKVNENG